MPYRDIEDKRAYDVKYYQKNREKKLKSAKEYSETLKGIAVRIKITARQGAKRRGE